MGETPRGVKAKGGGKPKGKMPNVQWKMQKGVVLRLGAWRANGATWFALPLLSPAPGVRGCHFGSE